MRIINFSGGSTVPEWKINYHRQCTRGKRRTKGLGRAGAERLTTQTLMEHPTAAQGRGWPHTTALLVTGIRERRKSAGGEVWKRPCWEVAQADLTGSVLNCL